MADDPIRHYLDEQGRHRVDRAEPVCDFCLAPAPTWTYPAADMPLHDSHPFATHSDDDWAACERCHDYIEASNIEGLVQYSVSAQPRHQPEGLLVDGAYLHYPPKQKRIKAQRRSVLRFLDARKAAPYRHSTSS